MAQNRAGEDAVALVVAAFLRSPITKISVTFTVFPTCCLPVPYEAIFTTFQDLPRQISIFPFSATKKYRNP
jgi:hypothetical protein